jgi:magnesium-transporting ATPase (P-type)
MMIKKIWDFCGDIKVNFWLIFAISLNLAIGAYFIKFNPKFFKPLNHSLIQNWFIQYGQYHPGQSWWIILLFILAFFLGINTFVCAVKRIAQLWPQRKQSGSRAFSVKIAPSLIHICFIIILAGHFLSLVAVDERNIPVQLNQNIILSEGNSIEVISRQVERYTTPVVFEGALKQCSVVLKLQSPQKSETRDLRVLNPIYWQGMSIHLDVFTKKHSQEKAASPELKLVIKKDPGVALVIPCFAILCLLMFWYFPQRKKT